MRPGTRLRGYIDETLAERRGRREMRLDTDGERLLATVNSPDIPEGDKDKAPLRWLARYVTRERAEKRASPPPARPAGRAVLSRPETARSALETRPRVPRTRPRAPETVPNATETAPLQPENRGNPPPPGADT